MRKNTHQLPYQRFEARNLLATVTLTGTELLITGGSGEDSAEVSIADDSDDTLRVSVSSFDGPIGGGSSQFFAASDVDSIRFVGFGGDDSFTNNTSIPSFAFGHAGNDTLIGGSGNDQLFGGSGDDVLTGNAGDDEIRAGTAGNNTINGNAGNDRLFGGNETNNIFGGEGDDLIFGGVSADFIEGNEGDDEIYPGHGDNEVFAGDGDDMVVSGRDTDEVFGGNGDDLIFTGGGVDVINGGAGDDWISGGTGSDTISGDSGADRLRGGNGNDTIRGGSGVSAGKFDIQTLEGGAGDDFLLGGDDADFARGNAGDDEIQLGAGNDSAFGNEGNDEIRLGDGNDYAEGGDGADSILGEAGNDNLIGGGGDDLLTGGSGFDAASYIFNQPRYDLISGFIVRDLIGSDGDDSVNQTERLRFTDGAIDAVFPPPPPPANDNFDARILLAPNTTQTTGTNESATVEVDEPINPGVAGDHTVWWEWIAASTGSATITTVGSLYDTTLAIYQDGLSFSNLASLGSNDDTFGLQSSVTFEAIAGESYFVQVSGFFSSQGEITLNYPLAGSPL